MVQRLWYGPRERFWLWLLAAVGLCGINGAFLVGLLAYLLGKWGVARLGWPWLVALSLLGGLAFAVPVVILWGRPREGGFDELNAVR